jgi:hypothetical protein
VWLEKCFSYTSPFLLSHRLFQVYSFPVAFLSACLWTICDTLLRSSTINNSVIFIYKLITCWVLFKICQYVSMVNSCLLLNSHELLRWRRSLSHWPPKADQDYCVISEISRA